MQAGYEDYLSMPMSLTLEEMAGLHRQMREEIGSDSESLELYGELMAAAVRYMYFRSNWLLWSREERRDKDVSRTSAHDSVIIKFNQLYRFLKMQGKDALWRDVLGYEENDGNSRKRIGDFACYLAFVYGILTR